MKIALRLILIFLLSAALSAKAETEKGTSMEKLDITINAQPVVFKSPPIFKDGRWLTPLESFSQYIGAKVEYPEGSGMAVICRDDRCVPLKIGDAVGGVIEIDGLMYAAPAAVAEPFGFQIQMFSPNRIAVLKGGTDMTNMENIAGQLAPDFVLPDLDGKPRRLSDFRGKKTLIYIWASW